jgi:hypothetical protein
LSLDMGKKFWVWILKFQGYKDLLTDGGALLEGGTIYKVVNMVRALNLFLFRT